MTQRIALIITSRSEKTVAWREREEYVKAFCQLVQDHLENVKVLYTTYRDLRYTVQSGKTVIWDDFNQLDLKDVQLVQFKNWQYETGEAPVVAAYLKSHGIQYFNSEVLVPIAPGKLAQMFLLGTNGIPVPDTVYASKEQLRTLFEGGELPAGLQYPCIMKANDGSRGDDNHLVESPKVGLDILSASAPDTEYVLQNFIPNDGDYRILFIGLYDEPLIFHRQGAPGSHLNNTSKGGAGTFMNVRDIPQEFIDYARRSVQLLGREIGGADIIVDKTTGNPYVLEVNGTPALATGYGVETKAKRFANFLAQSLDAQEEE